MADLRARFKKGVNKVANQTKSSSAQAWRKLGDRRENCDVFHPIDDEHVSVERFDKGFRGEFCRADTCARSAVS